MSHRNFMPNRGTIRFLTVTQKVDNFSGKNEAETPSNLVVSLVSV